MGWDPLGDIVGAVSDVGSGIVDVVSDVGSGINDFVKETIPGGWSTAALLAGGYYFAPQIGAFINGAGATVPTSALAAESSFVAADAAQLAAQGLSTAQIEATLASTGIDSFIAADAAQLASQGLSGPQISSTLAAAGNTAAASGGLTATQIANLAKAGISLAGIAGAANAAGGTGGLGLTQQDRSGFSSGSANYSPEYYQQIQSKYNQYMPQAKGVDITTDLKNWYETKYTPNVVNSATSTSAGTPTGSTTGTGYTTPTSMTNLGIKPQAMLPSYTNLNTQTSSIDDIAAEYAKGTLTMGGNTAANRATALDYLKSKGFTEDQWNQAYNKYLGTLPTATGQVPVANSTPQQIADAYHQYVQQQGGHSISTQAEAIKFLLDAGVPYATIEAAGGAYTSKYGTPQAPAVQAPAAQAPAAQAPSTGGMLTGGATAAPVTQQPTTQPLYTSLTASSTPEQIAAAYKQAIGTAGGNTAANQQIAADYLRNLGLNDSTISQGYGLFKGA